MKNKCMLGKTKNDNGLANCASDCGRCGWNRSVYEARQADRLEQRADGTRGYVTRRPGK